MYNLVVNWNEIIQNENKYYQKAFSLLSPAELKFIYKKDSFLTSLRTLLSFQSRKEEQLYQTGSLEFAFIFKTKEISVTDGYVQLYVLYSPLKKYQEDPTLYQEIVMTLDNLLNIKVKTEKKLERIIRAVIDQEYEAKMLPIDVLTSSGDLVFFTKMFLKSSLFSNLKLGINLFVVNMAITKNLLLVPRLLLSKEYLEEYDQ